MAAQSHEADDLEFLLRDALCSDMDVPSDRGRIWSGLLARIEARQRLRSIREVAGNQVPCEWLLGWRMMSLAHAVS